MSHVGILSWGGTPAVPPQMESWRHHETSLTDGTTGPRIHIYADDNDLMVIEDGSFCAFSGELYDVEGERPLVGAEAAARVLESMSELGSFSEIDAAGAATVGRAGVDRLFVARDPVGAGSLFFAKTPQHLMWASRLRDLVALLPSVSERQEAIDTYLAIGMVPSPWTFYREISRLGAGEAIVVERGEWRVERYHDFATGSPAAEEESAYDVLAEEFPGAVRRRLEGARTGILASGGVDSTLLLATAARELGHGPPAYTFEYGGYQGPMNEGHHARQTADIMGSPHRLIRVDPSTIPDEIIRLFNSAGEPLLRAIHTAMLSDIDEVDALLLGEGADGLYLKGSEVAALTLQPIPGWLLRSLAKGTDWVAELDHTYAKRNFGRRQPFLEFVTDRINWPISRASLPRTRRLEEYVQPFRQRAEIYADPERAYEGRDALDTLIRGENDRLASEPPEVRIRLLHLRFALADDLLRRTLDIAQRRSIPLRAPFSARPLLARWVSQPVDWSLRRVLRRSSGADKPGIRQLASEIAPAELYRRPKQKHSVPMSSWLRGPLRPWLEEVLNDTQLRRDGIFDPSAVADLLQQHMAGRDLGWRLWGLATVALWRDQARNPAVLARH